MGTQKRKDVSTMKLVSTGGKHIKKRTIDYHTTALVAMCGALMVVSSYLMVRYVFLGGV